MIFIGIDPGSSSYGFAIVNEVSMLVDYFEVQTSRMIKDAQRIVHTLAKYKPNLVALPSGLGLPFKNLNEITDEDLFYMTLEDPSKEGPLKKFLQYAKGILNGVTVPSVVELKSVPEYKKFNVIDMGTADKVAAAFFYRAFFKFDSFVLVELGSNFSAVLVVYNGKIIDGFGGSMIPGFGALGCVDAELAVLLCDKYPKMLSKNTISSNGNPKRTIEITRIIAEWYSMKYKIPIIVSGRNKEYADFGLKFSFPYKEAAVGAALIANSLGGGIYREYIDMLESEGNSLSYLRLLYNK